MGNWDDNRSAAIMRMLWQPIDTAPRDGTDVLVYARDEVIGRDEIWISYFYGKEGGPLTPQWTAPDDIDEQPTHWMPLPRPPEV